LTLVDRTFRPVGLLSSTQIETRQDDESTSINTREPAVVLADYAAWLAEQPLSARTRAA
jgi:hypothetical protein